MEINSFYLKLRTSVIAATVFDSDPDRAEFQEVYLIAHSMAEKEINDWLDEQELIEFMRKLKLKHDALYSRLRKLMIKANMEKMQSHLNNDNLLLSFLVYLFIMKNDIKLKI
ncbi:hypothetical protein BCU68_16440 [Vibrio sp. 10N.286.49.B3]|uniref:hypothetical protein n=1 Tax=Vibrio sp. 10N.286.49.B3 TaxID=1880855 RepID=UPI000C83E759|nr:hypothetical protein [Vibrio sp. 10N.286.49.B3]PMH40136.1 hypothetical protein BCU68_16440 [Vibrio sp. 10N.286.49.B3]